MKVLVVGGGGREHALAWRIAKSKRVTRVFVAPGNAGTALDANLTNVLLTSIPELVEFAKKEKIELTVVGPEGPLAAGIVDAFRAEGLKIFGPTRYAAQLESSKNFAKDFMKRHGIPTADYRTFTEPSEAHAWVEKRDLPMVIKADGLAAGKGVVVASTREQAHAAVDKMLTSSLSAGRSSRLLIEDCLQGEEVSFIVMVDGEHVLPLATSQDHKRLLEGDQGPNTGGMGAYSPVPRVTPEIHAKVLREIIMPTVRGMKAEGHPYTGFLYAGLMLDASGSPYTLEFNCRFGDPEAQPVLARLRTDLLNLLEHGVNHTLQNAEAEWDRRTAVGVVLATEGYPDLPRTGDMVTNIPVETEDSVVFHAGTCLDTRGQIETCGGRALCAVGLGDSLRIAQLRAYSVADQIHFFGKQMRRDIGAKGFMRR